MQLPVELLLTVSNDKWNEGHLSYTHKKKKKNRWGHGKHSAIEEKYEDLEASRHVRHAPTIPENHHFYLLSFILCFITLILLFNIANSSTGVSLVLCIKSIFVLGNCEQIFCVNKFLRM